MSIKLSTTHSLKTAKGYVMIAIIIACAAAFLLGVSYAVQAMYRYFEIPWVFDLRLFTLDYVKKIRPLINIAIMATVTAAAMATGSFIAHLSIQRQLHKSSESCLTTSQTRILDTEAKHIIRNIFDIKYELAGNIWNVIKPDVINAIQSAENPNNIDLTRIIKTTIAHIIY